MCAMLSRKESAPEVTLADLHTRSPRTQAIQKSNCNLSVLCSSHIRFTFARGERKCFCAMLLSSVDYECPSILLGV